jgi:hypothetical protein
MTHQRHDLRRPVLRFAVMVSRNVDEGFRQFPRFYQPASGLAMVDLEQFPFSLEDITRLLLGASEKIGVFRRLNNRQRKPADIMHESGGVGGILVR